MNKLFETVDRLEKFTVEGSIGSITLHYELKDEHILIPISEVVAFNVAARGDKIYGYLIVNLEKIDLGELSLDYLLNSNCMKSISVGSKDSLFVDGYDIEWASVFNEIDAKAYNTIFIGKKRATDDLFYRYAKKSK